MSKRKNVNFYHKKALSYGISKNREARLLEIIGSDLKDKRIFDIGCATGYFGEKLKKKGAFVTGIDISSEAIKLARKKIDSAVVVDLNSEKLPFNKKKFDIVIASEIIEHLFEPEKLLKQISQVLKPNGYAVISTPNLLYWGNRLQFLKGKFRYQNSGIFDRGHIHFYTHTTLVEDLEYAGLKVIDHNHVYAGKVTALKKRFPSFFAYQFVIKVQKK